MENIEIKTRIVDWVQLMTRLEELDAEFRWKRNQRDVFFDVPKGYLKLRHVEGEPAELIAYVREAGSHPRASDYDIARTHDGAMLEKALTRSLGIRGVVEKTRRLYVWRHTRIHLDDVVGLGKFLELEGVARDIDKHEARAEVDHVVAALDLDPAHYLDRPYLELSPAQSM